MEVNCGNCPLDSSMYGCHLDSDECDEFCKLVELSWKRYADEYLKEGS